MPTDVQRLTTLEAQVRQLQTVAAAFQGQPAGAQISIPHNDSWLFSDNVDATHSLNLRYVIASNVQQVVSARLSIHLAPYRTYNSFALTTTGTDSTAGSAHHHGVGIESGHSHGHVHTLTFRHGAGFGATLGLYSETNGQQISTDQAAGRNDGGNTLNNDSTGSSGHTHGNSADENAHTHSHNHTVSGSSTLGVTEGATATGVTLTFDGGADQSGQFGGPFTTDQIELNILALLPVTRGTYHVIGLQPSGLGRIDAHLRLSYYAAAGQNI
jgi:hypothetical protein